MPRGLGETQKKIGLCLVDHEGGGIGAHDLARRVYKRGSPTASQMNVTWAALKGLEQRKLIVHASTGIDGFRHWLLTAEGKRAFEPLRPKIRAVPTKSRS